MPSHGRIDGPRRGKRQPASDTWRMVDERRIIPAVEHVVKRKAETTGYRARITEGRRAANMLAGF